LSAHYERDKQRLRDLLARPFRKVVVFAVEHGRFNEKIRNDQRFRLVEPGTSGLVLKGADALVILHLNAGYHSGVTILVEKAKKSRLPIIYVRRYQDLHAAWSAARQLSKSGQLKTGRSQVPQQLPKEEQPMAEKRLRHWTNLSADEQQVVLAELREWMPTQGGRVSKYALPAWLREQGLNSATVLAQLKRLGEVVGEVKPGNDSIGFYRLPQAEEAPPPEGPKLTALEQLERANAEHEVRVRELKKQGIEELNLELDVVLKERAVVALRCRELDGQEHLLKTRIEELSK